MRVSQDNLHRFIYKSRYFQIPDFQRAYAWNESQARNFLSAVKNVINGNKNHYFGSVVYFPEHDHYSVIDGQQRLTTTLLFFIAIFHELAENPDKSKTLKSDIIERDYLYDNSYGTNKIILRSATTDKSTFERILQNKPIDVDKTSNLYNSYQIFKDFVADIDNLDPYIQAFEKFDIITIALDATDDNPQIIFENINSTGEPLTSGDKIRNYALMLNNEKSREYVYSKYWENIEKKLTRQVKGKQESFISEFFRNFIVAETTRWHNESDAYGEFKKFYNVRVPKHTPDELDAFYVKTNSQLENYLFIKFLDDENRKFLFLKNINFRLLFLGSDLRIFFIMQILESYKNKEFTQKDVLEILEFFERFLVRHLINGTRGIQNTSISGWINSIQKIKSESTENISYGDAFIQHVSNFKSVLYGVPTDLNLDYSIERGLFNRNIAIYLLATICDQKSPASKEARPIDILRGIYDKELPLSIEHIMPQKLTDEWRRDLGEDCEEVHETYLKRLANLTLTGYNSKYSNRSFYDKKKIENGFVDSPLYINKFISSFDKWDKTAIVKRTKWLQDEIKSIWSWPSKYD
jgi:uncharacterized protein with ParB-like and HNH nuclease domain